MFLVVFSGTDLWKPVFARGVYGGQVIGQALVAASKTKAEHMHCHSIHCSFIRAGEMMTRGLGLGLGWYEVGWLTTGVTMYMGIGWDGVEGGEMGWEEV